MSQAVHRSRIAWQSRFGWRRHQCSDRARVQQGVCRSASNADQSIGRLAPSCVAKRPFGTSRMSQGWQKDVFSVQIRYQPLRRNHGRTQSLSLIFSAPLIAIFRILKLPNLSTHETNSCNLFHQFHAVIIEFIYIVVNMIVDNNIDVIIPQTVHSDTQVVPIAALKPVLVVNRPAGRTPNGRRATQFE